MPANRFFFTLLVTFGANTLIAALLTLLWSSAFGVNLRYAQAIGLSIFLLTSALRRWTQFPIWKISSISILLGTILGSGIAMLWGWQTSGQPVFNQARFFLALLVTAVSFGVVVSYYFHSRAALAEGRARLQEEQLRRAENAQQLIEAEFKLLQAQIEPHFLFNTLSNVLHLIDARPQDAKRMLLHFTGYLRGSLRRTRTGATSLGEELDLVRAYLEVQAVRMGERLHYTIDCPPELRDRALPPLLLQPIVENAVRHGLEPKPSGGEVRVRAAIESCMLVLEVEDTGMGLAAGGDSGVGLANVRGRVRVVSQGRGGMVIRTNTPSGLRVRIDLPLDLGDAPASAGGAT